MTRSQPVPELFVLRHGQTDWNAVRRCQGQMNSRLSALGRDHAAQQGRILAPILAERPGIDIFCSPLDRTRETAAIALGAHFARAVFDDRLKEVAMGAWEGRLHADIDAERAASGEPVTQGFDKYFNAPGGETFDDMRARAQSFLDDLSRPAIVIAHGIFNMVFRGLVLGLDYRGMERLDHDQGVVTHIHDGQETKLTG